MEGRSRVLCEVIPEAQEVLRQWSCIYDFFGDSAEVIGFLNVVAAHFLARLSRNAFDVILTVLHSILSVDLRSAWMNNGFERRVKLPQRESWHL
jgi:hypothetical protein